jgi:hypothetical protein
MLCVRRLRERIVSIDICDLPMVVPLDDRHMDEWDPEHERALSCLIREMDMEAWPVDDRETKEKVSRIFSLRHDFDTL